MIYELFSAGDHRLRREQRAEPRRRVVKSAQLLAGDDVIDAIVLDMSDGGVRVRTHHAPPEVVTLQLGDGRRFIATRRWSRDRDAGYATEPATVQTDAPATIARRVWEDVRRLSVRPSIQMLDAAGALGDLRSAVEQVETSLRNLEASLAQVARAP